MRQQQCWSGRSRSSSSRMCTVDNALGYRAMPCEPTYAHSLIGGRAAAIIWCAQVCCPQLFCQLSLRMLSRWIRVLPPGAGTGETLIDFVETVLTWLAVSHHASLRCIPALYPGFLVFLVCRTFLQ